jgi:hypothetical protein
MRAGETRRLGVEIGNAGGKAVAARTYAADVYTIINGGFGGRLRGDAQTGVTSWLDYASDVLQLAAGKAIHRSFSISVPPSTPPGEYITSIILENDQPVPATGTVTLNQFVRQAMAVVISIPGLRSPGLTIAGASHSVVSGKSVVAIGIQNDGNVRLKPLATFTLMDAARSQVSHANVPMDTFYANTTAAVEVPLGTLLQPGTYSVHIVLEDALQGVRVEATRTFVVEASAQPATGGGAAPSLIGVDQQPVGTPAPFGWWVIAAGGLAQGVAGLALLALVRRNRGRTGRRIGSALGGRPPGN